MVIKLTFLATNIMNGGLRVIIKRSKKIIQRIKIKKIPALYESGFFNIALIFSQSVNNGGKRRPSRLCQRT